MISYGKVNSLRMNAMQRNKLIYLNIENKKASSIKSFNSSVSGMTNIVFSKYKWEEINIIIKLLDKKFEQNSQEALVYWVEFEDLVIPYAADARDIVLELGSSYLSFSVFKALGVEDEALKKFQFDPKELEAAGVRQPASLLTMCVKSIEQVKKDYWKHTFWKDLKTLPQYLKEKIPSVINYIKQEEDKFDNNEIDINKFQSVYSKAELHFKEKPKMKI